MLNMSKDNPDMKVAGVQSLRRLPRVKREQKIPASDMPDFLVRLAGWRRVKLAPTEARLRYRHD